jgi:GH25 family lysozyme M1 (1,4-beta-N-acetylmuramidase)
MKTTNGKMTYYDGNKKLSRLGVTLSEDSGEVDFELLRDGGIDFVMLKLGSRGYGTGLLSLDKNFVTNMEKAKKAGMDIGVYFCSQAVTVTEAVEEAKFVTDNLISYQLTYPVAYQMESISNDSARTDILDEEQKSQVAEAFLNDVENAGYQVLLYGDERWLLTEILSSELLKKYDVFLTDFSAIPEYPYGFKMWEYSTGNTISGVEREANYVISFVDYTKR